MSEFPGSRAISYSDAHELISRKILINKMSIEMLNLQEQYSSYSIRRLQENIKLLKEKKRLASELNDVFEKQLKEFTEERQNICLDYYSGLNNLDQIAPGGILDRLNKKLDKITDQMTDLALRIDHLEKTIPNEKLVTNFKLTPKLPDNHSNSCATEEVTDPSTHEYFE